MKEVFEKIIERLEEKIEDNKRSIEDRGLLTISSRNLGIRQAIEIVNQVAEEYKSNKIYQYAFSYAEYMLSFGVDIGEKWETASDNAMALNRAYLRGKQDMIDKFNKWQDEDGWIPVSSGELPEENIEVDVTIEEIDGGRYTQTSWLQDGQWVIKKSPLKPTVIAWKERPEPYQPKGE